jgi:hypothetical protein
MTDQQRLAAIGLMVLMIALVVIGLLVIIGLGWAWRRGRRRDDRPRREPPTRDVDAWSAAAQRMPTPPQDPEDDDEDDPPDLRRHD